MAEKENGDMYLIISAETNEDGTTAKCVNATKEGILEAGGEFEIINLNKLKVEGWRVCGSDGWGACKKVNRCIINDELQEIQEKMKTCEAFRQGGSSISGKVVNMVANAGGSGNGTVPCLMEMENWTRHLGAKARERMSVNRFNVNKMAEVLKDAAFRTVKGDYFQ